MGRQAHAVVVAHDVEVAVETADPREVYAVTTRAVAFARTTLRDVRLASELARSLGLQGDRARSDLASAYEKVDPIARLRETHRRRPRLQQEFDRAGLP